MEGKSLVFKEFSGTTALYYLSTDGSSERSSEKCTLPGVVNPLARVMFKYAFLRVSLVLRRLGLDHTAEIGKKLILRGVSFSRNHETIVWVFGLILWRFNHFFTTWDVGTSGRRIKPSDEGHTKWQVILRLPTSAWRQCQCTHIGYRYSNLTGNTCMFTLRKKVFYS